MPKETNEEIAELLFKQTYEERMEMAKSLHGMIASWVEDGNAFEDHTDADYADWLEALADTFSGTE